MESAHVQDLLKAKKSVFTVTHNTKLINVLQEFAERDILSAPVEVLAAEDESSDTYMGLIDVRSILYTIIRDVIDHVEAEARPLDKWIKLEQQAPECLDRTAITITGHDVDLKYRGSSNDSLLEIINDSFLGHGSSRHPNVQHEVHHRIALFNTRGEITNMLTMSDIIAFLHKHSDKLGKLGDMTVRELGYAHGPVVTVTTKTITADAFHTMFDQQLSAVAVVDEAGKFVSDLGEQDLRGLDMNGVMRLLMTTEEFLERKLKDRNSSHLSGVCHGYTKLSKVISMLAENRLRRLYVLNDQVRVCGVITLTDVLNEVSKACASH
ncbi:uncharacterized protein MONBRDRAFT_30499 [Monosiga brevicollis MX1]|uniref:CBS domain-containing protein n=1 Tax=Monosiga brevicollis TaxID=81824 RepID=A9VE35_MONBE|nr:uncharacterized protein MONBRDRAFT_30499 [Monosiga brevicollis MX1]EDQ84196.1 predicted protein [Monosiga brevicollis MX1]|eukprot:XP_001750984.1 hypothetical protein [Monosiga brevicollis MX1]